MSVNTDKVVCYGVAVLSGRDLILLSTGFRSKRLMKTGKYAQAC